MHKSTAEKWFSADFVVGRELGGRREHCRKVLELAWQARGKRQAERDSQRAQAPAIQRTHASTAGLPTVSALVRVSLGGSRRAQNTNSILLVFSAEATPVQRPPKPQNTYLGPPAKPVFRARSSRQSRLLLQRALGRAGGTRCVPPAEPVGPHLAFTAKLMRARCNTAGRACGIAYLRSQQSWRGREGSTCWQSRMEQAERLALVQSRRHAERLLQDVARGVISPKLLRDLSTIRVDCKSGNEAGISGYAWAGFEVSFSTLFLPLGL